MVILRHKTAVLDVMPGVLWKRGVSALGGRLHFCYVVNPSAGEGFRSVEWKTVDKFVGRRPRSAQPHVEREPGPWDDPDSYYEDA